MEKKKQSMHTMITRSKKGTNNETKGKTPPPENKDMDENGNLKGFIDYECEEDFDEKMFQKEISKLSGKSRNIKKKSKKKNQIEDLLIPYLFMNLLNPQKKENIFLNLVDDENESEEDVITDEEVISDDEEEQSDGEELSDDDSDVEMDEYDEEFIEYIDDGDMDEDEEFHYFQGLETSEKKSHIEEIKQIKDITKSNIPLRFKILNSDMDIDTKAIAITNIEKLSDMDISSGEYCKMDKWINGLISIPFGKYNHLPITTENKLEEKRNYLIKTQEKLDEAIYGHKEAKMHILQVIGKWIQNPKSHGNVLAIQGPMGNGKTTLVKEGISKAINRPFSFMALGGASDASFFNGHPYTYEGSHWGRIADILMTSKCMNPIIYFDELDKVSNTHKGDEIIHLLTHLTDPSQNSLYQDNYFPGVNIDLSKVLFIFSFNDESKVDRILKDRMYVINTNGFKPDEKIKICHDYVLPELLETFLFDKNDITFTDDSLQYIIETYTNKEEGVRNLKRCLETIISKINIYYLSYNKESDDKKNEINMTFKIDNFQLPITVTNDIVKELLSINKSEGPPEHMYM